MKSGGAHVSTSFYLNLRERELMRTYSILLGLVSDVGGQGHHRLDHVLPVLLHSHAY